VLVGAFALIPVAAIAVISLVRYGYLVDVGGDTEIGPVLGSLAFGCINLLVFGAAAGISYLHHDPRTLVNRRAAVRADERERDRADRRRDRRERTHREREQRVQDEARRRDEELRCRILEQERERKRRELELSSERHRAELEARRREATTRREQVLEAMRPIREGAAARVQRLIELYAIVDGARVALGEGERRVQTIAAERRALREATDAAIREVATARDRLVYAYCSANVRARPGHAIPACLDEVPALELPTEFDPAMAEAA